MNTDAVVECERLEKDFKRVRALQNISFNIQQGEIFGLVGPNGSGKTTTIRLLLGIFKPTQGTVQVLGHNPATEFHRIGLQLGVMLEQGRTEALTAYEYLEYFGGMLCIPPADLRRRVADLLQLVGLSDHAHGFLETFSKGMRQRVYLARCLLNDPRLLLLDEPFDGLDVESRHVLLDLLPQMSKERGTAVFITSHNLTEIEMLSDRVGIIKQGQLLAVDTMESLQKRVTKSKLLIVHLTKDWTENEIVQVVPEATYRRESRDLVFDLDNLMASQDEILLRLLKAGISAHSVERESASLEDVYFALTNAARD